MNHTPGCDRSPKASVSPLSRWLAGTQQLFWLARLCNVYGTVQFRSHRKGLVAKRTSSDDRRQIDLTLTVKGRREFGKLEMRQRVEVARMLQPLGPKHRLRLLHAMGSIERLLLQPILRPTVTLRDHRPGDMGWITHRQAILYNQEYGWNTEYEALIAEIMARFLRNFDPRYERCWVAECNCENVGSVFCVRKSKTVAQLRLLYVEPSTRGAGIGSRLVNECIAAEFPPPTRA